MNDARGVGVGERAGRIRDDPACLRDRHGTAGRPLAQGLAVDERHGEVDATVTLSEVEDRRHARMIEGRVGAGLAEKAFARLGGASELVGQDLERDLTPQQTILRLPD